MRSFSSRFLALAALCVTTSTVRAQQQPNMLEAGARVRLTSPTLESDQRIVRIVSPGTDTLVFQSERNPVTRRLALKDISAVERSLGEKRRTGSGAVIGLLAGAAIGGILGYTAQERTCENAGLTGCLILPASAGQSAALGGIVGGLAGLLVGTTVGWLSKSERWQRVPLNGRPAVAPSPGGVVVSIALPF